MLLYFSYFNFSIIDMSIKTFHLEKDHHYQKSDKFY